MRLKLLFLLMIMSSGLFAQDTIRSLVITEVRIDHVASSYYELTNMGSEALNLSEFEFGIVDPWQIPYDPDESNRVRLPNVLLQPGKSYVLATIFDFTPRQHVIEKKIYGYTEEFGEAVSKKEMELLADLQIHVAEEKGDKTDSVSVFSGVGVVFNGREVVYLRHHVSETDSAIVDQFNGIFTDEDGSRPDGAFDVAGVSEATADHIFMRKFSVKTGNTDFASGQGIDLVDSEWIPVPRLQDGQEPFRAVFWTVGNHGDYNLDASTLESSTLNVDFDKGVITVPWGTKNQDSIMYEFKRKPGIAWHYDEVANRADSAYTTCRTGDTLTIYVCGNDLDMKKFVINVTDPPSNANTVYPKIVPDEDGNYDDGFVFCDVGSGNAVMDTIYDIGYATRKDTLLKYLEKAPAASWEVIQVGGGSERSDLKRGDILKVTAENGDIKEYYIKVEIYHVGRNAYLSAITWPDIPDKYRNLSGWNDDTIPGFINTKHEYKVYVPADMEGFPALIAHPQDVNAIVEVSRATALVGDTENRTIVFTCKAEMDTISRQYKVVLEKQPDYANLQPYRTEPFISEYSFWAQFGDVYLEICNPGTVPLDLSKYMLAGGWWDSPADVIEANVAAGDWQFRYQKYIPGYKWQDQTNWQIQPAVPVEDLNINKILQPGEVFVIADLRAQNRATVNADDDVDLDFANNPWGEDLLNDSDGEPVYANTVCNQWVGGNIFLFKILNDSILEGTKPAIDPLDFELIDVFGAGEGGLYIVGGVERVADDLMVTSWLRKPAYIEGKPGYAESWGTTPENSEWVSRSLVDNIAANVPWPQRVYNVTDDIGSHFFYPPTQYKSTVESFTYDVSPGYSASETISDIKSGTLMNAFMDNIIKGDPDQKLTIRNSSGNFLTGTDPVSMGDTLISVSADSVNTTKYILEVTAEGPSNDAKLTSTTFTVAESGNTGTISGFEYGTLLKTVFEGVKVPDMARLTIIDANGAYVSFKQVNFDTSLVDVMATEKIFFEVVAQNQVTKILYQLQPTANASDAFIISSLYEVNQELLVVGHIPGESTVKTMLGNITANSGATIKILDKAGNERIDGGLYKDDVIQVTSQDGSTVNTYSISLTNQRPDHLMFSMSSNVYIVNNEIYLVIAETNNKRLTVGEFLTSLVPSANASVAVVNSKMELKDDDEFLKTSDKIMLIYGEGVARMVYTLDLSFITVAESLDVDALTLYPNPTTNVVNLAGLPYGSNIAVYNITGKLLINQRTQSTLHSISLANQPEGLYFITITLGNNTLGQYKVIKK